MFLRSFRRAESEKVETPRGSSRHRRYLNSPSRARRRSLRYDQRPWEIGATFTQSAVGQLEVMGGALPCGHPAERDQTADARAMRGRCRNAGSMARTRDSDCEAEQP